MDRPNLEFFIHYPPLRDALTACARTFAGHCQETGFYGSGTTRPADLAREAKAKLEALHELVLATCETRLDKARIQTEFAAGLDAIFEPLNLPPEVAG